MWCVGNITNDGYNTGGSSGGIAGNNGGSGDHDGRMLMTVVVCAYCLFRHCDVLTIPTCLSIDVSMF